MVDFSRFSLNFSSLVHFGPSDRAYLSPLHYASFKNPKNKYDYEVEVNAVFKKLKISALRPLRKVKLMVVENLKVASYGCGEYDSTVVRHLFSVF